MPSSSPTNLLTIEEGDQAAASGDWSQAIAIWERLYRSSERDAAGQRIRWFLDEAGGQSGESVRASSQRQVALTWLLAGVASGFVGTALVLFGESESGRTQDILAGLAWFLYILAAVAAVMYAYKVGRAADTSRRLPSERDLSRAVALAASMNNHRDHAGSLA